MIKILIITTGWTIDSVYAPSHDTVVPNEESCIPKYFSDLKPYIDVRIENLCMKDSRNISNTDRKEIVRLIDESQEKYILITHGTYTMPDTARFIEAHLKEKNKTTILTWSMIPIVGFSPSVGWFNLWFAIGSFSSLEPWVYVSMNARNFSPDEVMKTLDEWKFSSVSEN